MVIGIDASRAFVQSPTGTENYSHQIITHMLQLPEAKSHFFVLFTRPNSIIPSEIYRYSNVVVKEIKYRHLWTQVGLAKETWKKFSNSQIDVLWVPAHTLPILRNPRIKTVVTIHGLEYRWLPEYNNLLQRWYLPLSTYYAAKSADKIICVSRATEMDLKNEISFDIQKSTVIWEGVGEDDRSSIVDGRDTYAKYNLVAKKYILFVGTVQPRKNISTLIRAFAAFSEHHPDWKLVIAGSIGWKAELDLAEPERLGIPQKVIFTGRVSQAALRELYLGAGIFVLPSLTEGFGLPVLEAMALKVPVIVSGGGALPEIVGKAGVVVTLNSQFENNLAIVLERVAEYKSLQKSLISMGYKKAISMNWDKAAKATLRVLAGE